MIMSELTLYTTLGCHLCEEARAMLDHLVQQGKASYASQEIAESEALVEQYGVRIPVIRRRDGEELGWPFDYETLQSFAAE